MALTTNKIGDHEFIALRGEPIPPAQMTVVSDRPGVAGSETITQGIKGKPFSMISEVDAESYAAAKTLHDQYKLLIGGNAVNLVQGGAESDSQGYRVLVLGVEPVPGGVVPIRGASGRKFSSAAQGFARYRWDLIAVPT